ncbi:MAG: hypothetical protein ABWY54_08530 [Glaciihabitans sp.]
MPRELVISSPRSIDLADYLVATAAVDPDLGLRQLPEGVAVQICHPDGSPIVTVAATLGMDVGDDAGRLLGAPLDAADVFWTELYLPLVARDTVGDRIARSLAETVGGTLHTRSLLPNTDPASHPDTPGSSS